MPRTLNGSGDKGNGGGGKKGLSMDILHASYMHPRPSARVGGFNGSTLRTVLQPDLLYGRLLF